MPDKKRFKVLSEEGANFVADKTKQAAPELEQEVELDDVYFDQEKALVAAGWLERLEDKKKGK